MRRVLLLALAALPLASVGCMGHYWRCEMGKTGTISVPAAIQQGSGSLSLASLATTSAGPMVPARLAAADPCIESAPMPRKTPTLAASSPDCTLDEICKRLERIESRIGSKSMPSLP